jgi:hypothetical protein
MTGLIIIMVYLAGLVIAARASLPVLMERPTCGSSNGRDRFTDFIDLCVKYHGRDCAKPRGEIRDRQPHEAAIALGLGVIWPVTLLGLWIFRSAPRSAGELRRLNAEHERSIAALQQQLERNRRGEL